MNLTERLKEIGKRNISSSINPEREMAIMFPLAMSIVQEQHRLLVMAEEALQVATTPLPEDRQTVRQALTALHNAGIGKP